MAKAARMTARGLTIKQERFAQAVALEGLNLTDAYRLVYEVRDAHAPSVSINASRLMDNASLGLRIQELADQSATAAKMSRSWALSLLIQEAEDYKSGTRGKPARVRALELAMKHLGLLREQEAAPVVNVTFAYRIGSLGGPVDGAAEQLPPAIVPPATAESDE